MREYTNTITKEVIEPFTVSQLTNVQDFEMMRGDKLVFSVIAQDDEEEAIDLTDFDIVMTVKESIDDLDEDALFRKTLGDGVEKLEAENGKFKVTILTPDTNLAIAGVYIYDIQMSNGVDAYTIMTGKFVINPDVTQLFAV